MGWHRSRTTLGKAIPGLVKSGQGKNEYFGRDVILMNYHPVGKETLPEGSEDSFL